MVKQGRARQQARKRRQRTRQSKQRARANSYRQVGERCELVACLINQGWAEQGMASVFVLRRMPDGALAMAAFLIDTWCMGLKDAWGRLDISMKEFQEISEDRPEIRFGRTDFETVQRLIAGSIRFARENGFRLPRRYDRWVALAGVSAHGEADLGDFRRDGKLVYVGPMLDLRDRLIGQPVDEFLNRDDVQFAVDMDDNHIVGSSRAMARELLERAQECDALMEVDPDDAGAGERAEEQFEEGLEHLRRGFLDGIHRWCFSQGITPHPKLHEAWNLHELAMMRMEKDVEYDADSPEIQAGRDALEALLDLQPPRHRAQLSEALSQIRGFVTQFDSEQELVAATGLAEEDE